MNNIEALEKYALSLECSAEREVSMKNYTSFKVGGPAELFLSPEDAGQTAKLVRFCEKEEIPVFVLGKGSNLLVSDRGIKGAVIYTGKQCGISLVNENTVRAQSGASLAQLCTFALENSLSGLEFAYGIPGTVGGAVFMNAGAYGGEMKDVLLNSEYVSTDGTSGEIDNEAMELSYRHSAYENSNLVITAASVRLAPADRNEIKSTMNDILARRKEKQPLEYPSAGSTFKRPEGNFAGALIEQCGLKGVSVGGAQVSEKHAGFIINRGGATAADILSLIKHVQARVKAQTGVSLETEIRLIG
ncbi:MAG: UDP-N-acetylmuramate dehydrogenase [Acutalibacteraceae bacterium]